MSNKKLLESARKKIREQPDCHLTPEEERVFLEWYKSQRIERYPWDDTTWEGSEDEIPIRDPKKMKDFDKFCRTLVLD